MVKRGVSVSVYVGAAVLVVVLLIAIFSIVNNSNEKVTGKVVYNDGKILYNPGEKINLAEGSIIYVNNSGKFYYNISIAYISASNVRLIINSPINSNLTNSLSLYGSYWLPDGSNLTILNIFYSSKTGVPSNVSFVMNVNNAVLQSPCVDSDLDGYYTLKCDPDNYTTQVSNGQSTWVQLYERNYTVFGVNVAGISNQIIVNGYNITLSPLGQCTYLSDGSCLNMVMRTCGGNPSVCTAYFTIYMPYDCNDNNHLVFPMSDGTCNPNPTTITSCPPSVLTAGQRGMNNAQFTCACNSNLTNAGNIWGTSIYTDDSSICRAAVHAGKIPLSGGTITYTILPGQSIYFGSTQNGITSLTWNSSWGGSLGFASDSSNTQNQSICTDSDGGLNYYLKGIVGFNYLGGGPLTNFQEDCEIQGANYTSYPIANCSGSKCLLHEYYCTSQNNLAFTNYNCPNGCYGGACIQQTNQTINQTATCVDTDGYNVLTLGNTAGNYMNGSSYNIYDSCYNNNSVIEMACKNNAPYQNITYCGSGNNCYSGMCKSLNETIPSCTDSDGGINYNTKGTLTGRWGDGSSYSYEDGCNYLSSILIERYCSGLYPTGVSSFNCTYGCSNGACIQSTNQTIPAAPIGLSTTPQSSSSMIIINWNTVSGTTSYKVYRGISSGGETYSASRNLPPYNDTGLSPGTYYYKVTAVNSVGVESGFSNEINVIVSGSNQTIACPGNAVANRGKNNQQFTCSCSNSQTLAGSVYGTNIYTDDSQICKAAVHAGKITTSGGIITYKILPGQSSYPGSTKNGVTSINYPTSWPGSYSFV